MAEPLNDVVAAGTELLDTVELAEVVLLADDVAAKFAGGEEIEPGDDVELVDAE